MTKKKSSIKLTPEQLELASKLSPVQRKFVLVLVSQLKPNKTAAYVEAGGTAKTEESKNTCASRMFRTAQVKELYESIMASMAADSIMTKQEALETLTKSARATITDICDFSLQEVGQDEDGNPIMQTVWKMRDSKDIDPEILQSIRSVTFTKTGPKIEMYDRNGSIKILSDIQGWNAPRKQELTGKDGQALEIKADVTAPEIAEALSSLMSKL